MSEANEVSARGVITSTNTGGCIELDDLIKRYGSVEAVRGITVSVDEGEFLAVLGPSGAGKTSVLNMLAGFETPTSGTIRINGKDISRLAPHKRDIGMVFQHYALFPQMTVAQNVGFPLRMRGMSPKTQRPLIAEALELVRLDGLESRLPHELSGGQQQRVALARAVVFRPALLLMDEPLGALDKKLREHMRVEIKRIQRRLGATVIYVTHDQGEALTMADRVAVMRDGRIEQLGAPAELYERPSSAFVADFVGETNFMTGRVVAQPDGVPSVVLDKDPTNTAWPLADAENLATGVPVELGVRPERVRLAREVAVGVPALIGTVEEILYEGATVLHVVRAETGLISARIAVAELGDTSWELGDTAAISWDQCASRAYPQDLTAIGGARELPTDPDDKDPADVLPAPVLIAQQKGRS